MKVKKLKYSAHKKTKILQTKVRLFKRDFNNLSI